MRVFPILMTAAICLAVFRPVVADETEEKSSHPGFRPESEHAAAFLESVKFAKVAVYPLIIRTVAGTSYSEDSQKQVVSMLNEKQVTAAVAKAGTIDPGELKGEGQWGIFQNDL